MNRDAMPAPLDVAAVRAEFPGLMRQVNGRPAVFFDGPAGSQVPQRVADAVAHYLLHTNANHGGEFATSRESDALLEQAHRAAADLLGTDDPRTVVFGPNMTTLTLALSRALGRTWKPGDEVIVTQSDHDANITPWVLAARDAGAVVHQVRIDPRDATLDLDHLRSLLTRRTRLVAVGCASNATGTVHPFEEIAALAHGAGAEVFLDAVHYAPHRLMDVTAWQADYVVCSAYKFFGPHVGILWGRYERLQELPAYKVRPAPDTPPHRWMTGTQSHEGIVGVLAAIDYLADLGRQTSGNAALARREALRHAFAAIRQHEDALLHRLLRGLGAVAGLRLWGIADVARIEQRVPTVMFTHARWSPAPLAQRLAELGIFVWHGNYYALALSEALGLEPHGAVRVGLLHYNSAEEVDRLLEALHALR
jgi:cysteine desulfurase family protein (TIGR01976 family)